MLWWSLIAVCYGMSLRGDSPSLVELKATTERGFIFSVAAPDITVKNLFFQDSTTVLHLKEYIEGMVHHSPSEQALTFEGQVMEDGNTLGSYGVKRDSELSLAYT